MAATTTSCVTENHPENLLSAMDSLRLSSDLCDVVLSVGGLQIPAHRVVLAASSPYFRAMFTSDLKESNESSVTLHDVDPAAMKALVSHSYTGYVEIDDGNCLALFEAAHMLQYSSVLHHCCNWIKRHLDESNGLNWALFGRNHGFVDCEFQKTADCWAALSLKSFADRGADEFFSLSCDHLCRLLDMDQLRVESEEEVRELAWKWIRHDEENRLHHADRLLAGVRISSIADEKHAFNKDNSSSSAPCVDSDQTARQRVGSLGVVLAVGGVNGSSHKTYEGGKIDFGESFCSPISSVEFYDPAFDEWKKLPSLSTPRSDPGVVSVGGNVYVLGGRQAEYGSCDAERYDCQLVAFEGFIYGLGCCGKRWHGSDSAACERYDPVKNRWEEITPLPLEKRGSAIRRAIVLDGSIHVAIGDDDDGDVIFLKYDHMMDSWSKTPPCLFFARDLNIYDWSYSTVAMDKHLLVSQSEGACRGAKIEYTEYEEGRGVTTLTGVPESADGVHAFGISITAGKEKFYIVAGYKRGPIFGDQEYYFAGRRFCWFDIRTRKWVVGPNLRKARGYCGVAVVDRKDIFG